MVILQKVMNQGKINTKKHLVGKQNTMRGNHIANIVTNIHLKNAKNRRTQRRLQSTAQRRKRAMIRNITIILEVVKVSMTINRARAKTRKENRLSVLGQKTAGINLTNIKINEANRTIQMGLSTPKASHQGHNPLKRIEVIPTALNTRLGRTDRGVAASPTDHPALNALHATENMRSRDKSHHKDRHHSRDKRSRHHGKHKDRSSSSRRHGHKSSRRGRSRSSRRSNRNRHHGSSRRSRRSKHHSHSSGRSGHRHKSRGRSKWRKKRKHH